MRIRYLQKMSTKIPAHTLLKMAAHAALVSLMHIIEQIQHHPCPPISLDGEQVKSLTEKIAFLQDFLENYSNDRSCKDAEIRIVDAAYAAEDVIESRIVDQILDGCKDEHVVEISSNELHKDLQIVIEDMEFIIIEVVEVKRKKGIHNRLQNLRSVPDELCRDSIISGGSGPSISSLSMVGNDDVLNDIMEKLTGQQSYRQIIPIIGMGSIGKTTLAKNIYANPLIVQHFDVLGWVAISQEYRVRDILVEVLLCLKNSGSKESLSGMTENELGEKLYKYLSGRRYLIIMDDMWSIEAWDKLKFFFPDYNNQSRIIVTSRLSQVAFQLTDSYIVDMNFLNEVDSWNLLCKIVFGEEGCPLEMEEIGKAIAKNCKGLPLSVVVIGGLLRKSKRARECWEYIAENINPIVNLEDNERCLKILCTSYDELPVYLKPCFLYMGVFPEDNEIRVSLLIKLWVAEGFLKPIRGKSFEVVAEEYLKDLIDRNLILVHKFGFGAKIKSVGIHDLLRDLCLREAQETKFLCVTKQHRINIPQGRNTQRRVAIHQSSPKEEFLPQFVASESMPLPTRSLICDAPQDIPSLDLKLVRVLKADDRALHYRDLHLIEATFKLVNSRYITFMVDWLRISEYLSSISLFWNLQTLTVIGTWDSVAPLEIWKMRQLKHVKFDLLYLPDPPPSRGHETEGQDGIIVLENLRSLSRILNFKCGEEVVKRIPNIKKLGIHYQRFEGGSGYYLNNLGRLHQLESLGCMFISENQPSRSDFLHNLSFPHSLKKLTLEGVKLHWEDVATKIGSLPYLEVLKLNAKSFEGSEWETVEEQFSCLRFLSIEGCDDLEYWITESSHFPRLEHLVLRDLENLKEIPSDIGDILTLRLIELDNCSDLAVISAKEMLQEQEELGNEDIRVRVHFWDECELQSLASHNFIVEIW